MTLLCSILFQTTQLQFFLHCNNVEKTAILGWFKNPVSSQTDKFMPGTNISDYSGLKHYKKLKKLKHFIHLDFAYWPQSLSTYHSISPTVNSGHRLKKYVPVM